jgi:hypothetical protein
MTLSLAFLAPGIVEAAIEGRLPRGFGITRLTDLPMAWSKQWSTLGLPNARRGVGALLWRSPASGRRFGERFRLAVNAKRLQIGPEPPAIWRMTIDSANEPGGLARKRQATWGMWALKCGAPRHSLTSLQAIAPKRCHRRRRKHGGSQIAPLLFVSTRQVGRRLVSWNGREPL